MAYIRYTFITCDIHKVYLYMYNIHKVYLFMYNIHKVYLWRWPVYHGNANERQATELHMVRKEKGMKKWQLTGPEPVIYRPTANP